MSEVFSLLIVEEAKAECETGHTSAGSQSSNNLAQEKLPQPWSHNEMKPVYNGTINWEWNFKNEKKRWRLWTL